LCGARPTAAKPGTRITFQSSSIPRSPAFHLKTSPTSSRTIRRAAMPGIFTWDGLAGL
jgi:hypothetical protein